MIINFTMVSYPSLSAVKPGFQAFVVYTPDFTHKPCKVGYFDIFLSVQADQKRTGFNIAGSTPVSLVTRLFDSLCASLSVRLSFVWRISSRNQTVLRSYQSETIPSDMVEIISGWQIRQIGTLIFRCCV